MDRAVLRHGVLFLTGCCVTDVLQDERGRPAGVVMVNRSGRQAVRAKVIVDATDQAAAARQACAAWRPFVPGFHEFRRVVIGGPMLRGDGMTAEQKSCRCDFATKTTAYHLPVYEYTLAIDMPDGGAAAFFAAENRARDMTFTRESELGAETLVHPPGDTMIGQRHLDAWPGAERADLAAFRPRGMSRLYVLSVYADLGREAGRNLLRPRERS